MKANRRTDTGPERLVRSGTSPAELAPFRKDHPIRTHGRTVRVDIAFPGQRLAVFVDGCFWHQCPVHGTVPKANSDYWAPKLAGNVARDRRTDVELRDVGWRVLRIWEHQPIDDAVALVVEALAGGGGMRGAG